MTPQEIYEAAVQAGIDANANFTPRPMVVQQRENPFDSNSKIVYQEVVSDGECGFAWIKIKPARGPFVAWLKKNNIGSTDSYEGGYMIWISDYSQSMQRKEIHARAMARSLQANGINAHARSRLD